MRVLLVSTVIVAAAGCTSGNPQYLPEPPDLYQAPPPDLVDYIIVPKPDMTTPPDLTPPYAENIGKPCNPDLGIPPPPPLQCVGGRACLSGLGQSCRQLAECCYPDQGGGAAIHWKCSDDRCCLSPETHPECQADAQCCDTFKNKGTCRNGACVY